MFVIRILQLNLNILRMMSLIQQVRRGRLIIWKLLYRLMILLLTHWCSVSKIWNGYGSMESSLQVVYAIQFLRNISYRWIFVHFNNIICLFKNFILPYLIYGINSAGFESLKKELAHCYALKVLNLLHYISGIEVATSLQCHLLYQSKYIFDLFNHARFTNNKTLDTLVEMNVRYPHLMTFLWRILLYIIYFCR